MSKKIRNAAIFCLSASLILGSTLLYADTSADKTAQQQTQQTTTNAAADQKDNASAADQNKKTVTASANARYNPVNKKNETIYVSLDSYGAVTNTQVVNGYHLSGPATITDYGNYNKITNLTNFEKPTVNGDQITWKLDGKDTNFYYQGDMNPIALPWTITVRYKLNGVETKVEDLPGASGMVETIIDVKPNDKVSDYLKNNFFLQLSTSYDMGKNLSVEADDAVVVSLGDTKSVTYMTLPGEEATYHIFVGSNSFESNGFNFVMAPLKASMLDEVGNLKDAKERIQDAGDAVFDSIDTIVDSTSNIQNGLSDFSKGIASMQKSLKAIEAEGNANDAAIDKLTEQANKLNQSLQTLTPHLDSAQSFVNDLLGATNTAVTDLSSFKDNLTEIQSYTEAIQKDLSNIKSDLGKISDASGDVTLNLDHLNKHTTDLRGNLNDLSDTLDRTSIDLRGASSDVAYLKNILQYMSATGAVPFDLSALSPMADSASIVLEDTSDVLSRLTDVNGSLSGSVSDLTDLSNSLQTLMRSVSSGTKSISHSLGTVSDLTATASKSIDQLNTIIDSLTSCHQVFNNYQPECISALDDMKNFITSSTDLISAGTDLTDKVHNSVKKTKGDAYDSLQNTLSATIKTIDETIDALNSNKDLKKNSHIIKDTINNEWDRLEDDYNILNYDADAKPVSLVSDKNKDVDSIQIILNTPEITIDKKAVEEEVEEEEAKLSVWDRVVNIFKNMF